MKESTATIGDGRTDGHDRTGSECFPSRWPEINYKSYEKSFISLFIWIISKLLTTYMHYI